LINFTRAFISAVRYLIALKLEHVRLIAISTYHVTGPPTLYLSRILGSYKVRFFVHTRRSEMLVEVFLNYWAKSFNKTQQIMYFIIK